MKMKQRNAPLYALAGFILLAVLVFSFWPVNLNSKVSHVESVVTALLKSKGVNPARDLLAEERQLRRSGRFEWNSLKQNYRVGSSFSLKGFQAALEQELKQRQMVLQKASVTKQGTVQLLRAEVGNAGGRPIGFLYQVTLERQTAEIPPAPVSLAFPKGKGKIAIVVDDWGYSVRNLPVLNVIQRPLTIAILPSLPHSTEVARAAKASGHEVILHMPMEAMDPRAPREKGTILTAMPRQQVVDLLDRSLATVPSAKGMNNHQGSKVTTDPVLMGTILSDAKRHGLYFLDSFVSQQSVCGDVAARLKVRFARRTVFLDNEENAPAVRQQLVELARIAARKGHAIGIGHDRPVTVQVLREAIPELEKAGYTVVPVSELTTTDARAGD